MDPILIDGYIALAERAFDLFQRLRQAAQNAGATDEQLGAITLDYDQRTARREAESADAS